MAVRRIELDHSRLPPSATLARSLGSTHYFTGKLCKNGHVEARRTSDNKCLECNALSSARRRADPPRNERINQRRRAAKREDPEGHRRRLEKRRRRYRSDPTIRKNIRRQQLKSFGITPERYDQILAIQNGGCSICDRRDPANKKWKYFAVDHDHQTGAVRGLLCARCNFLIGKCRENTSIISSAVRYLGRNQRR